MQEQSVAVVSASGLVVEAMADKLLETSGFALSGSWSSRDAAFDAWVIDPPDVAVVDRSMLGLDPLGFIEGVRDSLRVPMLIRASEPTVEYVHLVLAAGAGGVLSHTDGGDALLTAIADVANAKAVVPSALQEPLRTRLLRGGALSYRALSTQERRVAGYVASGASAKEAADRLFIAETTVRKHLNHVYEKLSVRGHAHLLVVLIQLGIIDLEHLERHGPALVLA